MENIVQLRRNVTEDATQGRQVALACCVDLPSGGGMDGEAMRSGIV
jgi:hypothetical protein